MFKLTISSAPHWLTAAPCPRGWGTGNTDIASTAHRNERSAPAPLGIFTVASPDFNANEVKARLTALIRLVRAEICLSEMICFEAIPRSWRS